VAAGTEGARTRRAVGWSTRIEQVALAASILLGSFGRAGARPPSVVVRDGDPFQRSAATWAIGRYEVAELELPAIEIAFHPNAAACGGNSGFTSGGRIDLCTTSPSLNYLRATLLHEIAHAWLEAHLTDRSRRAFLDLRGLQTWTSPHTPWGLRGVEQAAEIMAWGLGDGTIQAWFDHEPTEELGVAFELLTERQPLNPETASGS
jgi:hypothetical protein